MGKETGSSPLRAHTEYRLCPNERGGTHFDYRNEFHAHLAPCGALVSLVLVGGIPGAVTETLCRCSILELDDRIAAVSPEIQVV